MLDEEVAQALRDLDDDVLRLSEVGLACADDVAVLELAVREARVLLTLDEHLGDWTVPPLSHRDFRNQLVILRSAGARWIRTAELPL